MTTRKTVKKDDTEQSATLQIDKIGVETLSVPIVGTAPLIVHNWSDKAKRQMLDKMQGKKKVTTVRDPESDYQASMYRTANENGEDGHGFPVLGFKAATIGAARYYDKSVTMTMLKQCLFFRGVMTKADPQQLVQIIGEPEMREDVVRISMGGTDLRYRAMYVDWSTTLTVTYVPSALSRSSVLSLIDAGGLGIGVGEWRPQRSGEYGTYRIDPDRAVEKIDE